MWLLLVRKLGGCYLTECSRLNNGRVGASVSVPVTDFGMVFQSGMVLGKKQQSLLRCTKPDYLILISVRIKIKMKKRNI